MISSAKVIRTLEGTADKLEDAFSAACPMCLTRFAAVLDCVCAACESPSCPECAVPIAGTPQVLCYACHVPTTH